MGQDFIQSNLSGGELAPTLHARIDIDKYNNSVANAKNMVIVPQGGLRRRPGLAKVEDGYYTEEIRIEPFIFNQAQKYIMIFRPGFIDIMKDGVLIVEDLVSPYTTIDMVKDFDLVQSADTVIIVHQAVHPQALVRTTDETVWTIGNITLVIPDEPEYDLVPGDPGYVATPVWTAANGYPLSCTFYGGRLWFGGSTSYPTSVWGSRVSGFFDFTWEETSGVIPDDHGIFDTIDSNQFNRITNIYSGRNLQLFTTGSEFVNVETIITPNASSWQQQTGYGSKGIRPIDIDGATLYIDASGRTIRQFIYDFNEDGYVSNNITLLASHLLTDIKSLTAIKGTSLDVSDYVYAINEDGSIAVMNTLRSEGLLGWTHWETEGEFVDACVLSKEVYILVKRQNNYFIEKLEENTYTDHNVVVNGVEPTTSNIIDDIDNIVDGTDNIVDTDYTTGTPVNSITTNYNDLFSTTLFKVIADFSMMPDSKFTSDGVNLNHFDISRDAYRIEVGLDFSTEVLTLPINTGLRSGPTLQKKKRIVKAEINVLDSLGIYAQDILAPDRKFTVVLDKAPTPYTGFREMYLLGYSSTTQLKITQENPLPMLIRAIGYEIEY